MYLLRVLFSCRLFERDLGFSWHCQGTNTALWWSISVVRTGPLAQLQAPVRFQLWNSWRTWRRGVPNLKANRYSAHRAPTVANHYRKTCQPTQRVVVIEGGFRGWEAQKLPVQNQSPQLPQAAYDNIALKMGSELLTLSQVQEVESKANEPFLFQNVGADAWARRKHAAIAQFEGHPHRFFLGFHGDRRPTLFIAPQQLGLWVEMSLAKRCFILFLLINPGIEKSHETHTFCRKDHGFP